VFTDGSSFDTAIALYTGSKLNNLVQVGFNDDCNENVYTSCLAFTSNASTTYYLQVRDPPHTLHPNQHNPVIDQQWY
jgi:hypothetical protein